MARNMMEKTFGAQYDVIDTRCLASDALPSVIRRVCAASEFPPLRFTQSNYSKWHVTAPGMN